MKTRFVLLLIFSFAILTACAQNKEPEFKEPIRILIFSKTNGYRHTSISSGLKMLYDQSKKQNWIITATEDSTVMNDDFLSGFDVAIFLNPTGDAIGDAGQVAFEKFMKTGKGFVGIHAASDFEYNWPFYGNLVGAYFLTHPPAQKATIIFEDTSHPAMKPFKGMKSYTTFDEWYSFKKNPRPNVHVLAHLDENTIKKSNNDTWKMNDHPVIWWNDKNGMRSFYTVFGHPAEAFQDEKVVDHITIAINWAAHRIN